MSRISLDDFFATMATMLDGKQSAKQCESIIGPSASGTERLGVYATLVDRQQIGAVESMFRAALVACRSWDAAKAHQLLRGFLTEHPPTHWSPAQVALPFAEYLKSHDAPTDIVELADFAMTRHHVLQAATSDGIDGLAVHYYTHAVREFTLAIESGEVSSGRPAAMACTWLLGRHRQTDALTVISPSLPLLVALQLVTDGHWSTELPDVDKNSVHAEAEFLAAQGLLSDTALAVIRRCTQ
jgi:hypothetical protein